MTQLIIFLFVLLIAVQTQARLVCNQSYPTEQAKFERGFVVSYRGPYSIIADRAMLLHNLGGCTSLDKHADKMMEIRRLE